MSKQKTFLFLAALFLSCATSQPAPQQPPAAGGEPRAASQPAGQPAKKPRKLTIVGINDTHGWLLEQPTPRWLARNTDAPIGGIDWFAGYLQAIRADAAERGGAVVVLDGGDLFQGTLVSNNFKGRSVVEAYNELGVTAAAVGNHEFDWGVKELEGRMAEAKFPLLAANIFKKGTRERPSWAKPTALVDVQGLKVGIIGLATVETPTVTNPIYVQEYEFAEGGPIAAQLADELRAQGATIVLITAHTGPLPGSPGKANPANAEAQRVAAACGDKVDAFVSGHHHTSVGCCRDGEERCRCGTGPITVGNIPIVQSGSKLQQFSLIELDLDEAGRKVGQSVNKDSLPFDGGPHVIAHRWRGEPARFRGREVKPDQKIAAIVRGYDVQVQKLRESRIGATEVTLTKGGANDLIANLAVDALRSGAGGGLKANFAFQNQGGLRIAEIAAGPITYGQIFDLLPFDNQQVVLKLKAHEVRNALETMLKEGKGPLRVSGLRYTVDLTKRDPRRPIKQEPPGKLVPLVVDEGTGAPLCKTESCAEDACTATCVQGDFRVAMTDFLANGGDGLADLVKAPREVGTVLARDIVIAYVKEHVPLTPKLLGSTKAGAPQRVTQVGAPVAENAE